MVCAGAVPTRPPAGARLIRIVIAATNLPLLVILVVLGGADVGVALALAVAVALAWSIPPLRTRDRPVLDVLSGALLVVLPAVSGLLVVAGDVGVEIAEEKTIGPKVTSFSFLNQRPSRRTVAPKQF
jgi:hypothetical protein